MHSISYLPLHCTNNNINCLYLHVHIHHVAQKNFKVTVTTRKYEFDFRVMSIRMPNKKTSNGIKICFCCFCYGPRDVIRKPGVRLALERRWVTSLKAERGVPSPCLLFLSCGLDLEEIRCEWSLLEILTAPPSPHPLTIFRLQEAGQPDHQITWSIQLIVLLITNFLPELIS